MNNLKRFDEFSNSEILDENEKSGELNLFEQACYENGIDPMTWNQLLESEDYEEDYDEIWEAEGVPAEKPKKKGFLKKAAGFLGKIAGGVSKIAGPILKNLGLPMGGAVAGLLGKLQKGLQTIGAKGIGKAGTLGAAAKEVPEMKQVSSVVQSTIDKLAKEIAAKGPEALFNKGNRESMMNLAAVAATLGEVTGQALKSGASAAQGSKGTKPAGASNLSAGSGTAK